MRHLPSLQSLLQEDKVAVGDEEEGELLGDRVVGGWNGNGRERKTRGDREPRVS